MTTYKTSEWVSPAHPDKCADCISEYILDQLILQDPKTRYAVEVQIKDNVVNLAGELTTNAKFTDKNIKQWVKEAVRKVGYTKEYQFNFGEGNTICADDLVINMCISKQSPDISLGVNKDAWGDQGIFFGYYSRETEQGHGIDFSLAKRIGQALYIDAVTGLQPIGIDIKTQVTVKLEPTGEYDVTDIIVAVPTPNDVNQATVNKLVKKKIKSIDHATEKAQIIINGTGAYHIHGPVGDSGTTGRKLVVDFYGSRSRIGGGSPWTKDATKADLTLNLFAYDMAKRYYKELRKEIPNLHHVETELACCIGRQEVSCFVTAFDEEGIPVYTTREAGKVKPSTLIKQYGLDTPVFFEMCINGLFSRIS